MKGKVVEHNSMIPLPDLGRFERDLSRVFAIQSLQDERKQALYAEIYAALNSGGILIRARRIFNACSRWRTH